LHMMNTRAGVIIRNAQIYDGTGSPPFDADIALRGDRIVTVGQVEADAATTIDAKGLALAPGFIDVHSHDDFAVFFSPEMDFKVMQGVTTDIVGNCGSGVVPFDAAAKVFQARYPGNTAPQWDGYPGYMDAIDRDPPSINVAVLVGHGTLRTGAMGIEQREPVADELTRMRSWLREGMEAGAVGLSTGLIYEPGRYAKTDEIIALAHEVAATGGLYASHMRNEAAYLLDAIRETIQIGEQAGVPVEISHHKASGRENWGRVNESLLLIEQARARGLDVTADQYPYTSGSTTFYAVVQNNALNQRGSQGGIGRVEPRHVLFASAPHHPEYEGQTLQDLCDRFDLPAEDAARRIVDEEGTGAFVVIEMMDEADVRTVMRHPTTMIGSDGVVAGSKPHPRLYGCFPRILGRYVREEGLLSLEEAIYKMTGFPAAKFRLTDRGQIREGAYADLVLFDPATVIDTGTYAEPKQYPRGMPHVFVNGVQVVRDGRHTGARSGRVVRRG
ncbi:MAG: N-acyl-D-amino-acid deacylase family protein, partial [Dehalococcoidia bacterium]